MYDPTFGFATPHKLQTVREAAPLPAIDVDINDGAFSFEVPGRMFANPHLGEGQWTFAVDFGAEQPAVCAIYLDEPIGMGRLSIHAFQKTARRFVDAFPADTSLFESVFRFKTHLASARPILEMGWIIGAPNDRPKSFGVIKVLSAFVDQRSFVCAHSELGYYASFLRVFRRMVDTMDVGDAEPPPYFEQLFEYGRGRKTSGFRLEQLWRNPDGTTDALVYDIKKRQTGSDTAILIDEITTETSAPDGTLLRGYSTGLQDGLMLYYMAAEPSEKGWTFTGQKGSRRIMQRIERAGDPPMSVRGLALIRNSLIDNAAKIESVSRASWLPMVEPAAFSTAIIRIEKPRRARSAWVSRLKADWWSQRSHLDQERTVERANVSLGDFKLTMRRVYRRGVME